MRGETDQIINSRVCTQRRWWKLRRFLDLYAYLMTKTKDYNWKKIKQIIKILLLLLLFVLF